jgi:hypothetical protein
MRALLVLATLAVWGLAITFGLLMPGWLRGRCRIVPLQRGCGAER